MASNTKKLVIFICCGFFFYLVFYDVNSFIAAGRSGLELVSVSIVPVLFPFFFVTSFMVESGLFTSTPKFFSRITSKVYKVDGKAAPVLFLGIVGGFPTSARMLSELYSRGEITRQDAIRISTFTSTASPIFIIGTVGVSLYASVQLGIIIFVSTVTGAIINGLLYRNVRFNSTNHVPKNAVGLSYPKDTSTALANALTSAIQSILSVGGLIIIFFIIGNQLDILLNLSPVFDTMFSSVLEMTTGVFKASNLGAQIFVPLAIISFGGLCVALQGMLFFKKYDMPFWFYLLYKSTHMILSIGVAALVMIFI